MLFLVSGYLRHLIEYLIRALKVTKNSFKNSLGSEADYFANAADFLRSFCAPSRIRSIAGYNTVATTATTAAARTITSIIQSYQKRCPNA